MSGFNKKTTVSAAKAVPSRVSNITKSVPDTVNKAGGQAFSMTNEFKLVFALVSTFMDAEFYRTRVQTVEEIKQLINAVTPDFAAKAAIFARTKFGMRSASHLVAAVLAYKVKGEAWTKHFYNKVVYRVDDASEILAAYIAMYGKPIPNSLKKGLALALSKFSKHQLAKYKGEGKGIKLVDLFNLIHPKPDANNAEAFKQLMNGELASENTWESQISAAGQDCKTEEEKKAKKTEAWLDLLSNNKLGYFALLRNLRNILQTGSTRAINLAAEQLVNPVAIKKSLVLPFRYISAQKELEKTPSDSSARLLLKAVNDALEISLSSVPHFAGETLVAIDRSGSMGSLGDPKSPASIASLFGAVIAKVNNADVLMFDTTASHLSVNLSDSLTTVTGNIQKAFTHGGTDFRLVFNHANKKYDRIIILSDMQAWVGHNAPLAEYQNYCIRHKANPKIYCFDLAGYGTSQFPANQVYSISGFSEKTLDIMQVLEINPNEMIDIIKREELG